MGKLISLLVACIPCSVMGLANLYFATIHRYPPGLFTDVLVTTHWFWVVSAIFWIFMILFVFPVPRRRRKRKKDRHVQPINRTPNPLLLPHQRGYPNWPPASG
jgi:uncharacterized membrane protein